MIGDSATDIMAGKKAGITTVAVTFGIGNKQKMVDVHPDHVIDSFSELQNIVKKADNT
jgi:phosphoglycolate phosphatase-like HAD superfamily hydrolase